MPGRRRSDEQGSFWGDLLVGPNPTDRAKNGVIKRSILVEADGGPLSAIVAGANVPDFKLLEETLNAIVVERPTPTEKAPDSTCACTKATTTRQRERSSNRGATYLTFDASAKKRDSMMRASSAIRRGVGWWSW